MSRRQDCADGGAINPANDEARMTNDEGNKMLRFFRPFGFRHSFVIRHSDFVIPPGSWPIGLISLPSATGAPR
jgi:hypothetical protein